MEIASFCFETLKSYDMSSDLWKARKASGTIQPQTIGMDNLGSRSGCYSQSSMLSLDIKEFLL